MAEFFQGHGVRHALLPAGGVDARTTLSRAAPLGKDHVGRREALPDLT